VGAHSRRAIKNFVMKLSELRVVAFVQFAKKSEKTVVTLWILSTKTYFSQRTQVAITLSQLAKDASIAPSFKFILHVHRQASCYSETFFWKFFERTLFILRHLQSFVVAFIEQVQKIEKSKASIVEVVSCFASVKARIQKRSDVHIKPS